MEKYLDMKAKGLRIITFYCCMMAATVQAQWAQKQDFPGTSSMVTAFSVNNVGYFLTGDSTNNFWKFDPRNNTWTSLGNFPGPRREKAVGFTIGNIGYFGTGVRPYSGSTRYNDLWAYDPSSNTWTQKASMPAPAREEAIAFSIGNKGYVGGGWLGDFWEYDPSSDTWIQKANLPYGRLHIAVAFAINGKGYVGTGDNPDSTTGPMQQFWEYDPATNVWMRKADFGGGRRAYAAGFAINGKGYIGTGYEMYGGETNDLWEYNPTANIWTQMANFGGPERYEAVGIDIGGKGYIMAGNESYRSGGSLPLHDTWEFTSISSVGIKPSEFKTLKIFPNPSIDGKICIVNPGKKATVKVFDIAGKLMLDLKSEANEEKYLQFQLSQGVYSVMLISNTDVSVSKLIIQK